MKVFGVFMGLCLALVITCNGYLGSNGEDVLDIDCGNSRKRAKIDESFQHTSYRDLYGEAMRSVCTVNFKDDSLDFLKIEDVKTFFVALLSCKQAYALGNRSLGEKIFQRLCDRENLEYLQQYVFAIRQVFEEPSANGPLSLSALGSHYGELVIITQLLHKVLKNKPRVPNYMYYKSLYEKYIRQMKS